MINQLIANKTGLSRQQVEAVISLLNEGATIPFIARYRKERTGALDEVQIAEIQTEYQRLQELTERKQTILKTIDEQGALTPELKARIEDCWDATTLEDIYLPYKPHRKTRADIAREKGYEPLAKQLMSQPFGFHLPNDEAALQGARDIIAEWVNLSEKARAAIRREFEYSAVISSKVVSSKLGEPDAQTYLDYFDCRERLSRIASHRLLAMRRGENEGFLRVDISPDQTKALEKLYRLFVKDHGVASEQVAIAVEDSYKRLLKPAIETEFAASSKQKADTEAINVFAENARQLLLAPPLGQKRILAIDPGFRTGCKVVVLSAQGDLLTHDVIFPTPPRADKAGATRIVLSLLKQFQIQAIAIGNGTASRETEAFVRELLENVGFENDVDVFVVSESGASVYSASPVAREEFPDEDVTVRGAVSIGRRLMDPLAELVKIDPKSIGVGQYQHDVDQTQLKQSLTRTVESVVNHVGVDVNTASKHLLTYISGLGPVVAKNIVDYRAQNGPFPDRKSLLKVPKMGPKTFEQSAGFLRIAGGTNPLDNSAVHPERYELVERMARDLNCTVTQLMARPELQDNIVLSNYFSADVGNSTLQDIKNELRKPSRDPRGQMEVFHFSESVHSIEDLDEGMLLPGIVTNLTAFGAFIDVGVHQDGLLHISELSRKKGRRLSSAGEVLSLGQHIEVRIKEVDLARKRISLTF